MHRFRSPAAIRFTASSDVYSSLRLVQLYPTFTANAVFEKKTHKTKKKSQYRHPGNRSKPDDRLTQSSVPQSMFSLLAKLCNYPEYKELLQSYPNSSEDGHRGPSKYKSRGDNSVVAATHYGFGSIKNNVKQNHNWLIDRSGQSLVKFVQTLFIAKERGIN